MYDVYPQKCEEEGGVVLGWCLESQGPICILTCSSGLFQFSSTAVPLLLSTVLLLDQVDVSGAWLWL